jgi:hypothetical protein
MVAMHSTLRKEYDKMQQHVTILGALYIAFGILGILAGTILFVVITGGGLISGDNDAMTITAIVGTVLAAFLFLLSIPGIIGGIGLLNRKEWARILTLILGFLNLINIPFGTLLGAYTIWALMRPEAVQFFAGETASVTQVPQTTSGQP